MNITRLMLAGATIVAASLAPTTAAQDRPHVVEAGLILPVTAPPIENGAILFEDGMITAIGPADSIDVPANAVRIDARDKTIMPGLICTHSHIGGWGGGDRSAPLAPEARILDSVNVKSSGFRRALAGGLTALNIMPGSGHLMSGQTIYVKLREAATIDDMVIRDADGRPMGGMKMANGTNPQGDPPFPGTRGKAASLVRELFVEAENYRDRIAAAERGEGDAPDRDLGLEALVEVLEGRRVVHHHTHRHDDIITVLRLSKEFGFRVVLHHVSEAWKVADQIAEAGAPCSIIMIDSPGGKLEAVDLSYRTGAILEAAGVETAYHTDDWITDSRVFLRSAALGVRAGLSREGALRSVTQAGAVMMDLGDRIGSLEPGKDADFVVLSGDPLSIYTQVLETWIEGEKRFDRSDPEDRLYAVGGYGATHDQEFYLCCQGHHGEAE